MPAGFFHRGGDFGRIGGDPHRADIGLQRATPNMHDHRLARDIGKRLPGQPGRGHAGRNQDENIRHSLRQQRLLIRVATRAANRLSVRHTSPPPRSLSAMDSFELNKVLGALLGTCLVLVALHIASGAIFASPVPAKPGYIIEVKQEGAGEAKWRHGGAGRATDRSVAGQRQRQERRADREGMRAVPQSRQGPGHTRSAPIFTASSAGRSRRRQASTIPHR